MTETKLRFKDIFLSVGKTVRITEISFMAINVVRLINETVSIQTFSGLSQTITKVVTFLVDAILGLVIRTRITFDSGVVVSLDLNSAIIDNIVLYSAINDNINKESAIVDLSQFDSSVKEVMEFESVLK